MTAMPWVLIQHHGKSVEINAETTKAVTFGASIQGTVTFQEILQKLP